MESRKAFCARNWSPCCSSSTGSAFSDGGGTRTCEGKSALEGSWARTGTVKTNMPMIVIVSKLQKRPIRASLLRPVLTRTGGGRRLVLLIIVLIVFATTKNFAPKALFLLVLVLGLGGLLVYSGRLPLHWDGAAATYIRRRRGRSRLGFNAKNSLENVAMRGLLTGLGRLGTVNKGRIVVVRAGRGGDLVGGLIQGQFNHTLGRSERFCI